jgi:hypothetical protein
VLRRLNLIRLFVPLCLLGVVLLGGAGKLWLIQNYGSDVPYQEMWVGDGECVLRPWLEGHLTTAAFFHPHNEHRIALTRALSFAEVLLNGQWDNRLQTVVNTFIHGLALALLVALLAPRLSRSGVWITAFMAALLVALPFAWENTLVGFQSQFYLLLLLAGPGVWLSLHHRAGTPAWFVGMVACGLALFTIVSGLVVAAAVAGVALLRAVLLRERRVDSLVTAVIAAAVAGVGLWLYEPVTWNAANRAGTLWQFTLSFANQLTFPLFTVPWLLPLLQLPVLWWLVSAMRDPDRKESVSPVAGLLLFQILHAAVLAFARGGFANAASPRYCDLQAVSVLLNAAALAWLWHRQPSLLPQRIALTAAWTVAVAIGLQFRTDEAFADYLPNFRRTREAEVEHFRRFVATGDEKEILDPPDSEVGAPRFFRPRLVALLADPGIRKLLPVSIRPPVSLQPGPAGSNRLIAGFGDVLPDPGRPSWITVPADEATSPVFASQPLRAGLLPILRFRIAGDLGTAAFPLGLHSMDTGETVSLRLDERTGQRWRTVNLERPPDPAVLVLGPSAAGTWGAFTAPVEMGLGSWYAGKLAKNWLWFTVLGSGCFVAAMGLLRAHRPRPRDTFSLHEDGSVRLRSHPKTHESP